jgi:hypothetical protein
VNFLGQSEGGLKSLEISSPSPKLNLMRTGRGTECKKKAALLIILPEPDVQLSIVTEACSGLTKLLSPHTKASANTTYSLP